MGISNLLPFLRPITTEVNIRKYEGHKVGIDAMCWMHRGAVACAAELAQGRSSDKFLRFVIDMLQMLISAGAIPVLVFDGKRMPAKRNEEDNRRSKREENLNEGIRMIREEARHERDKDVYAKLVSGICVTSQMVDRVLNACKMLEIEYLVAPYEADAQLAFMCRTGYVRVVITEDSDLLAYGCPRVVFKMDKTGLGQEIDLSRIASVIPNKADTTDSDWPEPLAALSKFDQRMFTGMCVLSGSDYSVKVAIKGIGIKTAFVLMNRYRSLSSVLKNIALDPKWKSKLPKNTEEYKEVAKVLKEAETVFLRHIVVDVGSKQLKRISESYSVPIEIDEQVEEEKVVGSLPSNYSDIMVGLVHPDSGACRNHEISPHDENAIRIYQKFMQMRIENSKRYSGSNIAVKNKALDNSVSNSTHVSKSTTKTCITTPIVEHNVKVIKEPSTRKELNVDSKNKTSAEERAALVLERMRKKNTIQISSLTHIKENATENSNAVEDILNGSFTKKRKCLSAFTKVETKQKIEASPWL